jgi:polysaccharide export outer membrane protein
MALLLFTLLLVGCTSQKQVVYLQDLPAAYSDTSNPNYEPHIQPDDMISIIVNSRNPELVQMFNLPLVTNYVGGTQAQQNRVLGYSVDREGCIDFPQLGSIHLGGMTRNEVKKFIQQELIDKGLVGDPVVTVQFLNFKVSVLGEVAKPGSFEVTGDRITLLDAISRAGDLTIYGKRDNVKVIREAGGERSVATLDLRSKDIFSSPYYYLSQNDVVYVEPNKAKAGQREINQNRTIGTFASIVSVLISLAVLIWK